MRGNRNALKHAIYTREAIAERRQLRELMRHAARTLFEADGWKRA